MTDIKAFYDAAEATWPPASTQTLGPWTIREGRGGGKRVSAATAHAPITQGDIPAAEAAMRALGQPPLFMIRDGDAALDSLLDGAGYRLIDPVVICAAPVAAIATEHPPATSTFTIWEPLAIMKELWAETGIGPERLAVMGRVTGPKTAVLGRVNDRAAGAGFVAIHQGIAVIHAVSVTQAQRRQRTAVNMMREAAYWAQDHGATTLCALVTAANAPARALYASLGMRDVGHYHYRIG